MTIDGVTADAGRDFSTCDTANVKLEATLSGSGTGTWSSPNNKLTFTDVSNPGASVSGLKEGKNVVIWTVSNGLNCRDADSIIITLKTPAECDEDSLQMPTGYSPNGDGYNDNFVIHGIVRYPINDFKVFNRWGNLVYERQNYQNEWRGLSTKGEKLPDGTYFAILKIDRAPNELHGYVDLRR